MFNLMPLKAIIEKKYGRRCDEAENGLIAVQMYQKNMTKQCCEVRYQCIFTDINMPEMDGIKEAKVVLSLQEEYLRENPSLPKVEIIMVTAYDTQQAMSAVKALGIKKYLIKPVNIQQVLPILE